MRSPRQDAGDLQAKIVAAASRLLAGRPQKITQSLVRQSLLDALEGGAAGLPLPPVRVIARLIGTTPVTVQRSVAQLVAAGRLVSRERSGIFTAEKNAPLPAAWPGGRPEFCFATDSLAPFQAEYWQRISQEFHRRYPETSLQLNFAGDTPQRDAACDAFERLATSYHWAEETAYLDIRDFAWEEFAPLSARLGPHRSVRLSYRTTYLFGNAELMKKHGLPSPRQLTFAEQTAYLREASAVNLRVCGRKPPSAVHPVVLLGAQAAPLRQFMTGDGPWSAATAAALARLIEQSGAFQYHHNRSDHRETFLAGQTLLFAGNSFDLWNFSRQAPKFPWLAYPLLTVDDGLSLQPVLAAVNASSRNPLECLRLIALLVEADEQGAAAGQGGISGNREILPLEHCSLAGDSLARLARRSEPFCPQNHRENYLFLNILGGELWRVLEGRKELERLPETIRNYAQSYLATSIPKPSGTGRGRRNI